MQLIGCVNNMNTITSKSEINIDNNFKVEAGPGAGKTEFLINHVKNIIQNSNRLGKTRKIACITYTNSAAENMVQRLGGKSLNYVEISTIHSFLYRNIVKPYCSFLPKEFKLNISRFKNHYDSKIYVKDIREWIKSGEFSDELSNPTTKKQILSYYKNNWKIPAIKNWLSSVYATLNDNGYAEFKSDMNKGIVNNKIYGYKKINPKNLSILEKNIKSFKIINWKKGFVDHEDILYFTDVLISKYPFILEILKTKYPYFFIDEFQDTNHIQTKLLTQLKDVGCTVGIIGDEAQSIYSFAGADAQSLVNFDINKSDSYIIKENHRSTEEIVEFLNVIRTDIRQKSVNKNRKANETNDLKEVIILIGNRDRAFDNSKNMCDNSEVVSLSRKNKTVNEMKIRNEDVIVDESIYDDYFMNDSNHNRRRIVIELMQVIEYAEKKQIQKSIKLMEKLLGSIENGNELYLKRKSIEKLIKLVDNYNSYSPGTLYDFHQTLREVFGKNISDLDKNSPIINFYKKVKYKDFSMALSLFDEMSDHLTIHQAKGNGYNNVFIVGDDELKKFLLKPDLDQEEHRIRYVALSRAINTLFIQLDELTNEEKKTLKNNYNCSFIKI